MILAIESASTDPSLALARMDGAPLRHDAWSASGGQGRELLPRVLGLLGGEGRRLGDIRGVAVGLGPGSFTGLRSGMSLAKGLAVGLGVPLLGIPSLMAWLDAEPQAGAALSRAGAHEGYLLERGHVAPRVVDLDRVAALATPALGPIVAPAELGSLIGPVAWLPPGRAALAVALAAAHRLASSPQGDDVASLQPAYLRPPRGLVAAQGEVPAWR